MHETTDRAADGEVTFGANQINPMLRKIGQGLSVACDETRDPAAPVTAPQPDIVGDAVDATAFAKREDDGEGEQRGEEHDEGDKEKQADERGEQVRYERDEWLGRNSREQHGVYRERRPGNGAEVAEDACSQCVTTCGQPIGGAHANSPFYFGR